MCFRYSSFKLHILRNGFHIKEHRTEKIGFNNTTVSLFFQSVNPYFVCSNMTKIKRPSTFVPSARSFVTSALGTVGQEDLTSGYLPHHLTVSITYLMKCQLRTVESCLWHHHFLDHLKHKDKKIPTGFKQLTQC